MRTLKLFFPIIASLLFLTTPALAQGYKVSVATAKGDTSRYVLKGWIWGDKVQLDTVKANKGKVIFKSKKNLGSGTYEITDFYGKKLHEFIVPRNNRNFTLSLEPAQKGYATKKGDKENKIYTEFLNLINYGWEKMSSADEFVASLGKIKERAEKEVPNSLLDIILTNTLTKSETAEEFRDNFPLHDSIILNTFFGEDKVGQYLKLLQYNHNDTIIKYVDSLISGANSPILQNRLAHTAYEFFYDPEIMGQEGVAVHIASEWFLNDKLEWPNQEGKFMLRTFVEFNRHSLIGMDAPELELIDTTGNKISLRSMEAEYTILYFYTDDCPSCRKETPMLVDFVNGYDKAPLAVYAVYADSNSKKWKEYINNNLYIFNPFMNWVNVYDPEYDSNFQMLYNVIKTPQMFLLDKEMKIIGRGLNVRALKELINEKTAQRDQARELIEQIFIPLAGDTLQIYNAVDMFYNSSKGDELLLKEFMGEIYNTLGGSKDYTLQQGAVYLAEKYIIGMPQMWNKEFIEKKVRETAVFKMNKLGNIASDITLEKVDGSSIALSDITKEYKVLYFYRPNCGTCMEVTPKMVQLYNEFQSQLDLEVVAINLGGNYSEWINYISSNNLSWENVRGIEGDSSDIYSNYYLESVPTIYLLKDNVVIAKDINDIELKEILNTIIQ